MDPVQIKTKKFPIPYRGPDNSAHMKDFVDNIYFDLDKLAEQVTRLNQEVTYIQTVQYLGDEITRNNTQYLLAGQDQKDLFQVKAGYPGFDEYDYLINMYDSSKHSFDGDEENHAYYSQNLGLVKPPRNGVSNLFYYKDALKDYNVITRDPTVVFNTEPSTSDFFLSETDTINMFNGNNSSYWSRQYSYAMDNDISSVTLDFTVTIPAGLNLDPNYLVVDPYPSMGLTINSITSNLGAVTSVVIENSGQIAVELAAGVTDLTFNITQPSSRIQNGRKVFILGFREIDAQAVDWDERATATGTSDSAHIVLEQPLLSDVNSIDAIKVDGDCQSIEITGYLNDVKDSTTLTLTRAQIQSVLHEPSFTFTGDVDTIKFGCFINADPTKTTNRVDNLTTDTLTSISMRVTNV